ncbi:phosphoribosyltransferase [Psychromonas sp. MME1]|uniref:phosphoribosyltransferase n=2 Tax=unclassified Psychromonas TaxID=2614957 RepID=UPI0034E1BE1B
MDSKNIGEMVLSTETIVQGVNIVAEKLNSQFKGQTAVIISIVPGGIIFTADLVRQLQFELKMDYISCIHTPGDRNNSSDIIYFENVTIKDQHVILVDDAIESGGTMKRVAKFFTDNFQPKSLSIATLFVKPGRVKILNKQYFAYEMANDDMLIGYGLPWQDKYRNLPFVSKLIK